MGDIRKYAVFLVAWRGEYECKRNGSRSGIQVKKRLPRKFSFYFDECLADRIGRKVLDGHDSMLKIKIIILRSFNNV